MKRGVRDLKTNLDAQDVASGEVSSGVPRGYEAPSDASCHVVQGGCSNVVSGSAVEVGGPEDAVSAQLGAAREMWARKRDRKALRRALLGLLRVLEDSDE